MEILWIIVCSLLMLVGLAGIILPYLPGLPMVWGGLLVYAITSQFQKVSIAAFVIFTVLTALTLLLDFLGPMIGLKKFQASKWSYLGSFIGFIVGVIFFNIWGVILGPLIGAFVVELIVRQNFVQSVKVTLGALLGQVLGNIIKIAIALAMIGYFVSSFFR
jgi:uncharacterized protein YqgC (DUF456 family)